MHRLILALATCLALASGQRAEARDLSGLLGLGGYFDAALAGGLSLKYWVSDLGLQGLFAFDSVHSNAETPGRLVFRPAVRVLYAMTRSRLTNLYIGVGVATELGRGARLVPAPEPELGEEQAAPTRVKVESIAFLDVLLGAEFFVSDTFAVSGNVTFSSLLGSHPDQKLISASWGAAFHWYFGSPKAE